MQANTENDAAGEPAAGATPAPGSENAHAEADSDGGAPAKASRAGTAPERTSVDVELERSLYAKREKIYPREVHGIFAQLRVAAVVVLLGLFYGVAWLSWNGQQLLLFDLPNRHFHVFGLSFLPQDFVYLTGLLILAALSLFLFTALAGRLWCGYACPQTVWTEIFMWMERKIEGDRPKQMKLDKQPLGPHKIMVKGTKHTVWILFSLWTGFTFVGYFTPIRELAVADWGPWETFWVFFYGFATYGNAGWMREQVCIYMCPYARFQSAMFDRNTLIIAYDEKRGEPRGSRSRSADRSKLELGDCINCTLCVQACPTGIDIRDGLQYQCIACAACIDACDEVMERMGYDKGLIRYSSESAMQGEPSKVLRPRVFIYAAILTGLAVSLFVSILTRVPVELDVIRDRMALFREATDGRIENVYTVKLINKSALEQTFALSIEELPGAELLVDVNEIVVAGGGVAAVPVRVRVPRETLKDTSTAITFRMRAPADPELTASASARFIGPRR